MTAAKCCDRCQRYYSDVIHPRGDRYADLVLKGKYIDAPRSCDLCRECYESLQTWMLHPEIYPTWLETDIPSPHRSGSTDSRPLSADTP